VTGRGGADALGLWDALFADDAGLGLLGYVAVPTRMLQGGSARKGELEIPHHSVFMIQRASSSPFLAEHPCRFARRVDGGLPPRTGRCELAAEDQPEPAQREELRLHLQGGFVRKVD
jgi:hypothetical protein